MTEFRLIYMETERSRDSITHDSAIKLGERVIEQVRKSERHLLKNIKWISIAVATLYVWGYIWRSSYYDRLGIPHSFLDFPFPEILVPQSWLLIAFAGTIIWPFVCQKFYEYYIKARRQAVSESIGISCPIQDVIEYLSKTSNNYKEKSNTEVLLEIVADYFKEIENKKRKFTNEDFENLVVLLKTELNGLSQPMKDSITTYLLHLLSLENEETRKTIDTAIAAAAGLPPKGIEIPNTVLYLVFIIIAVLLLYVGLYWHIIIILIGNLLGIAVYKLSHMEDRTDFWKMLWVCIIIACGVQHYDARMTAAWKIKHGYFPVVRKVKLNNSSNNISPANNGGEIVGILLGFFKGKFFVASIDNTVGQKLTILDSERVKDMEITYSRWLEQSGEKARKELRKLAESLSELETELTSIMKRNEEDAKQIGDPNALDNIKRIEEQKTKISEIIESIKKRLEK